MLALFGSRWPAYHYIRYPLMSLIYFLPLTFFISVYTHCVLHSLHTKTVLVRFLVGSRNSDCNFSPSLFCQTDASLYSTVSFHVYISRVKVPHISLVKVPHGLRIAEYSFYIPTNRNIQHSSTSISQRSDLRQGA
jgi:hypothetical protein